MSAKPLFIPLKRCYYDAFEEGSKPYEMRVPGKIFNLKSCYKGRRVTLSPGYVKNPRLYGTITKAVVKSAKKLKKSERLSVIDCYGTDDMDVLLIYIKMDEQQPDK